MKPIIWMGDSLVRLRTAAHGFRKETGFQLDLLQKGDNPADFKPMPDVGPGVYELRIHEGGEFRVFYVAKFGEAVYVLHCFSKRSQSTAKYDLSLGRRRYLDMLRLRMSEGFR